MMDAKNDDSSAGSDSLDKSLQKKCVVDDVGQGEGTTSVVDKVTKETSNTEQAAATQNSKHKKQKTAKNAGDGGDEDAGGGGGCSSNNSSTSETKTNAQNAQDTTTSPTTELNTTSTNNIDELPTITNNAEAATTSLSASSSKTNSTTPNNAFETKVKQISKNLKETTLAETANNKKTSLEDIASSSSSSSSSSTTSENELVKPSCSSASQGTASVSGEVSQTPATLDTSISDSLDETDHRSKKVRFHPDVKENDGGNRVIPKKKKKLKAGCASGDEPSTSSQHATGSEDEMEMDEEEDILDEEEEFDLTRTIAEAQDYLKIHPLTFVRPNDKNAARLQNGLLDEEDLPQQTESSEDEEDFYENVPAENGVLRILGKLIKGNKVEFLLRYADRPGLFWESEDFICKQCPNLLNLYEQNRERRQQRLMRHVAKRQNVRQRYTDF